MPSRPTARDALTRIASPGRRRAGDVVERRRIGNPFARFRAASPGTAARPHRPRPRARSRARRGARRSPRGSASPSVPSSAISPENRDPAAAAGPRDEIEECRPHRGRVGVVGIVDDHPSSGQRQLLPAPAGQRDRVGPRLSSIEWKPEGVVGEERRQGVLRHVARGERQRQARARPRRAGTVHSWPRPRPRHGRIARSRCRHGRDTERAREHRPVRPRSRPRGRAAIASAFAWATRSTVPTSSRCSGPIDVTIAT